MSNWRRKEPDLWGGACRLAVDHRLGGMTIGIDSPRVVVAVQPLDDIGQRPSYSARLQCVAVRIQHLEGASVSSWSHCQTPANIAVAVDHRGPLAVIAHLEFISVWLSLQSSFSWPMITVSEPLAPT